MIEFDTELEREKLAVQIFRFVQEIPFKFTDSEDFDNTKHACKETVTTNIDFGDSKLKSTLLYNLFMQHNFEGEKVMVIFDWKDLPIPSDILDILENSSTKQAHLIANIKLSRYAKSYLDPTWDSRLKKLGFPVTEDFDGKSGSVQITKGKLEYCELENFKPEDYEIITDEEEYAVFKEAINEWIEESVTQK